jgi:hypothetical protein
MSKETYEQITNKELVGNLGPDDLLIHARHNFLSAAKDLINGTGKDLDMAIRSIESVLKIQESLDVWEI